MRALAVLLLIFSRVCLLEAQALPVPSQANIVLSRDHVEAGKSADIDVSVSPAPSFAGNIFVTFSSSNNSQFGGLCSLTKGQKTCKLTLQVPIDLAPGVYELERLFFNGSKQYDMKFTGKIVLTVAPPSDPIVIPTEALATLDNTTRQVLRTRAEEVEIARDALQEALAHDGANTPLNRAKILATLIEASRIVSLAKSNYRSVRKPTSQPFPVLFDDLLYHYRSIEIEFRNTHAFTPELSPHFARVQLKQRPEDGDKPKAWPLNGTKFALAAQALQLMATTVQGLRRMADTGLETFQIDLKSVPQGAAIYYRLDGDSNYKQRTEVTDQNNVELLLGLYTFRFSKDGCNDAFQTIESLAEKHPVLTGELNCKAKKP